MPHRARLGTVVEDVFGSVVQLVLDGQKVLGCVAAKVDALGEVVAQQAVHVLVRAALPGRVGVAEVDRHASVWVIVRWRAISVPWSQVIDRSSVRGRSVILAFRASWRASPSRLGR